MSNDDLSFISFSIPAVGTVMWEMPEQAKTIFDALNEPAAQQALKERLTNDLKGFFCTFAACLYAPSAMRETLNNISRALDEAADINISVLNR